MRFTLRILPPCWPCSRPVSSKPLKLKVFVQPGSAVPPSAWEESGGYYGYDEQREFVSQNLDVTSLDEVMDWPAVWNPENPGYARMWGMIGATLEGRAVVSRVMAKSPRQALGFG